MTVDVETIIVGAGVVGLACARALTASGHEVMVLERNDRIGAETSSRNSEVIHAGLYYPPGSLRARLCVAGKSALYAFAEESGIAVRRRGKLLVATGASEVAQLETIAANAAASGVGDLVRLTGREAQALEPELACVAAYLSPSTGVIDTHALMLALEGHVTSHGGQVVLGSSVIAAERQENVAFSLSITSGDSATTLTTRNLVLAAGLGGSVLGARVGYAGDYRPPATYPAKGHYFTLTRPAPFQHLIYPVPTGAWLGVHLTIDIGGQAKFGPDIDWIERIDYAFDDPDGSRRARFIESIRRWWPGLPEDALQPGYTGIRPKIYRHGDPIADFAIHGPVVHGVPRLVALYGIESPGLTSCLAIGRHVRDLLDA